jgi:hypothetical protein
MKVGKYMGMAVLLCGLLCQGCALLLVGAAAGAAGGTVSYLGNELRVNHETTVDKAWNAASAALSELQFHVVAEKSYKDATGGTLNGRNAKDQPVKIQLIRQTDRLTEIRIRVGTFDTAANRSAAQLLYDKMRVKM